MNPLVPEDPFALEPESPSPTAPAAAETPVTPTPTHEKVSNPEPRPSLVPTSRPSPISRPVPLPSALVPPPVKAPPRPIQVVEGDEDLDDDLRSQRRRKSPLGCTVLASVAGMSLICAGVLVFYNEELLRILTPISPPPVTKPAQPVKPLPAPTPAAAVPTSKAASQSDEQLRERIGREWANLNIPIDENTDLTGFYQTADASEGSITITCKGGNVVPHETLLKSLTGQPFPNWSRNNTGQLVVTNFGNKVIDEPITVCKVYGGDGQLTNFLQR